MPITINSSLKIDKVLNNALVVFKRRLAPLNVFSTKFQAAEVPKDKYLQVPYFGLDQTASTDWNSNNGYGDGSYTIGARNVPVNKRKFQVLSWQSGDLLGAPDNSVQTIMDQKADKLASDVIADVMSIITAANYSSAILSTSAAAFDDDDLVDIRKTLSVANWPTVGRGLVLNEDFIAALLKLYSLKDASASGSTGPLREGQTGRLAGFEIYESPVQDNSENLVGFACMPSAVLIAAAPVEPDAEVRSQLHDYRVVTDPDTGLSLTYRAWGEPGMDKVKRVLEFGYGYAKGDEAQLKRITHT